MISFIHRESVGPKHQRYRHRITASHTSHAAEITVEVPVIRQNAGKALRADKNPPTSRAIHEQTEDKGRRSVHNHVACHAGSPDLVFV